MTSRTLLFASAILLAGAGAFFFLTPSPGKIPAAVASCTGDDCRPAIRTRTISGQIVDESSLAGKIVLVNFWATWCPPCLAEIPGLSAVYRRHRDAGFVIVGVAVDSPAADLPGFVSRQGMTYPVVVDAKLERAFGSPDGLPASFLYDRAGHLHAMWQGEVSEEELEDEVAGMAKAPADSSRAVGK